MADFINSQMCTPMQEKPKAFPELHNIFSQENSRLYGNLNEVEAKVNALYRLPGGPLEGPQPANGEGPHDFNEAITMELDFLRRQNSRLEILLKHLSQLV